jgi:hypothetical protein
LVVKLLRGLENRCFWVNVIRKGKVEAQSQEGDCVAEGNSKVHLVRCMYKCSFLPGTGKNSDKLGAADRKLSPRCKFFSMVLNR